MADPSSMSIKELKTELQSMGVRDFSTMLEKSDLIARLTAERENAATRGKYLPKATIVGETSSPEALMILTHGLGDSAAGWTDVAQHLSSQHPRVLFVLPTAENRPVTMNMGMRMPSWYDIKSIGPTNHDEAGMRESAQLLNTLADEACKKYSIERKNVIFGGFSQGAVVSLWAGMLSATAPKGILMLSGYLGAPEVLQKEARDDNKVTPVLMCHGKNDPMVAFSWAQLSAKGIKEAIGVANLEFKEYAGLQHSANPQEIADVSAWMSKLLA